MGLQSWGGYLLKRGGMTPTADCLIIYNACWCDVSGFTIAACESTAVKRVKSKWHNFSCGIYWHIIHLGLFKWFMQLMLNTEWSAFKMKVFEETFYFDVQNGTRESFYYLNIYCFIDKIWSWSKKQWKYCNLANCCRNNFGHKLFCYD